MMLYGRLRTPHVFFIKMIKSDECVYFTSRNRELITASVFRDLVIVNCRHSKNHVSGSVYSELGAALNNHATGFAEESSG